MASKDNSTGKNGIDAERLARGAKKFAKDEAREFAGAEQWKRSKIGFLTGVGTFIEAAGTVKSAYSEASGRTRALFAMAFKKDTQGVAVSEPIDDPKERFRAAMIANQKTLKSVNASVDATFRQFWLYAVLAFVNVAYALYMTFESGSSILGSAFRLLPLPLACLLAVRAGYTNWMFRRRSLDGLPAYFRSGEMLPKHAPPLKSVPAVQKKPGSSGGKGRTPVVAVLLIFAVALIAIFGFDIGAAIAAVTTATDPASVAQSVTAAPSSTDLFTRLLSVIVPNIGPVPAGEFGTNGMATATAAAFGIFSGVLLFVGTTTTFYQILTGLVASAKEGTALGKQWHEVWAPVRVVIGFGFLTPVAGGICAAQVLVIYLIVWGGNLANVVWAQYTAQIVSVLTTPASSTSSTTTATSSGLTTDPDPSGKSMRQSIVSSAAYVNGAKIAHDVMQKELCFQTLSALSQTLNPSAAVAPTPTWTAASNGTITNAQMMTFTVPAYGGSCGKLVIYQTPSLTAFAGSSPELNAQAAMTTANQAAIGNMVNTLMPNAATWAQTYVAKGAQGGTSIQAFTDGGGATTTIISQAITNYATAMTNAAIAQYSATNPSTSTALKTLQANSASEGWAEAGAFYLTLGRIQNQIYTALDESMSSTTETLSGQINVDTSATAILSGSGPNVGELTQFETWWQRTMIPAMPSPAQTGGSGSNAQAIAYNAEEIATTSWSPSSLNHFMMGAAQYITDSVDTNPFNAMTHMINYGNGLEAAGFTAYFSSSVISGIGRALESSNATPGGALVNLAPFANMANSFAGKAIVGALGGMAEGAGTALTFAATAMLAAGIVHAWVIPMVPYVQTVFFVLGMLILTVESLAAAPLWAFFHIRMDGQEFVDQVQRPGYMIAFNLLLRPTLMIFGLVLSYLVFGAVTFFISHTFTVAMGSIAGSNSVGIVGMIVLMIMLAYLHYQAAIRSFHLITQLPDRVSRWFGHGGEHLGEEQEAHTATNFIVGGMHNNISSIGRGLSGQGIARGGKPGQVEGDKSKNADPKQSLAQGETGSDGGTPQA